jgi:hypothetical protein
VLTGVLRVLAGYSEYARGERERVQLVAQIGNERLEPAQARLRRCECSEYPSIAAGTAPPANYSRLATTAATIRLQFGYNSAAADGAMYVRAVAAKTVV